MRKLKAKISLGTFSGGSNGWHITVEDALSGVVAVEVTLTPAQFAEAIGGRGMVPCKMEFNDSGRVGLYHEWKEVEVTVPGGPWEDREYQGIKAVKEHEVDGWKGRTHDTLNSHNIVRRLPEDGGTVYLVHFDRWVPKKPGKGAKP